MMHFKRKNQRPVQLKQNFCAGFRGNKKLETEDLVGIRPYSSCNSRKTNYHKLKSGIQNGIYFAPLLQIGNIVTEVQIETTSTRNKENELDKIISSVKMMNSTLKSTKLTSRPGSAVQRIVVQPQSSPMVVQAQRTRFSFRKKTKPQSPPPPVERVSFAPLCQSLVPLPNCSIGAGFDQSDRLITMFLQGKNAQIKNKELKKEKQLSRPLTAFTMNDIQQKQNKIGSMEILNNNENHSIDELQDVANVLLGQAKEIDELFQKTAGRRPQTSNNISQNRYYSNQPGSRKKTDSLYGKETLERFIIGDILGKGSYAVVRIARDKLTGGHVAIKTYEKQKLIDSQKRENVKREIQVLQKCKHPHIIKLLAAIDSETAVHLVMEYPGGKSMREYLKQFEKRRMTEDDARIKFRQIASAIDYCHSINVLHRDIKLENILLDQNFNIKVIDFGFAIIITENTRLNVFCGTPSYMAPEVVSKQENYGRPADVWSLGVLLYVFLNGQFPFRGNDDTELFKSIKTGYYKCSSSISLRAQRLINNMLRVNQNDRFTTKEILKDPWIL